ncbi:sporulation histidine kinase inhibitor Sda [Marinicrinis sediminis]|uniref:Sporulation histidine kinase inhibitor Sda n=1 Tax=Marinicrinis sediminis TaxID=1652465 RepID=A0ABW5R7F7_9BACL
MRLLSNEALLETYEKAVDLQLEHDFIHLIIQEMRRRGLKFPLMLCMEA